MADFLVKLFDTSGFPARWDCGTWETGHGWLHILSDFAIFGAYFAIPITILFYLKRKSTEIAHPKLFWLFGAFIFSCGTTHLIEAIIFYHPIYRVSGLMKLITAIISWATVFAIIQILPAALDLPGLKRANSLLAEQAKLQKKTREKLERSNKELTDFTRVVQLDLRDPVCSALFMAELAKEAAGRGDLTTAASQIDQVLEALAKSNRLVNELHERSLAER